MGAASDQKRVAEYVAQPLEACADGRLAEHQEVRSPRYAASCQQHMEDPEKAKIESLFEIAIHFASPIECSLVPV